MTLPSCSTLQEMYTLAPHTLYRIGGPARWAFWPATLSEVQDTYAWIKERELPLLVMGAGSNLLIDDRGFDGAVLFTTALQHQIQCGTHRYRLGAGLPLADIVRNIMLPGNFAGTGALTGIPGTLGGALFMNAGTVNGTICQFTEEVTILYPEEMRQVAITPDRYSYRGQSFCTGDAVILEALLAFSPSDKEEKDIYQHYIQRRLDTQPQGRCCGSVFKNPPNDHAGRLIESCGLKGTRRGGAIISPKHANFIMNEDNATFDDVYGLIQEVKQRVWDCHHIALKEEVRIIRQSPDAAAPSA